MASSSSIISEKSATTENLEECQSSSQNGNSSKELKSSGKKFASIDKITTDLQTIPDDEPKVKRAKVYDHFKWDNTRQKYKCSYCR